MTSSRSHGCWSRIGVDINVTAPLGATPGRHLPQLGAADFNVVLYPEIAPVKRPCFLQTPCAVSLHVKHRAHRLWCHARLHSRGGRALTGLDPAPRPIAGERFADALVVAFSRFDLSDRQACLRLRGRDPRDRRRPGRSPRNSASRSSVMVLLQPRIRPRSPRRRG
jgi:hypothetical protein